MAEAVGLAASIWTISSLAVTSAKVAKDLLKFACDSGEINDEIKSIALTLDVSSTSLHISYKTLQNRNIDDPNSPLYRMLRKHRVLETLAEYFTLIHARVERVPALFESFSHQIKLFSYIKWLYFHKDGLMCLLKEMEYIKLSVSMIVSLATLELNQVDAKTACPTYTTRLQQEKYVRLPCQILVWQFIIDLLTVRDSEML